MKKVLALTVGLFICFSTVLSFALNWSERKSSHFVIYFKDAPEDFIDNVIDAAEEYYREITSDLGFTRYGSWTWEDRAKIYIYKDADDYVQTTKQPEWSSGSTSYRDKVINTFPLASGFFDTLLPHELGHIIFREFVGFRTDIPLWLDEGVASYQEKARRWGSNKTVKKAIEDKTFIPLDELSQRVLSAKSDRNVVELFYAESGSVVYYLITKFGKYRFVDFCRALKEGRTFEDSLRYAYSRFENVKDLNRAWLNYLENE
ncbi:MAG: peptidase MA family metallohydrolase [Candidatus Omnitrophota bacterium]|nr:peptidase MA family metallohydrolase [Candidatus Omnitrophota bacterium]